MPAALVKQRSSFRKAVDTITFPIRAVTLFHKDLWGLSSLATERFDYVARHVRGFCLDIGCGPGNRFITEFCNGNGIGIDVYHYNGLTEENIVNDMTRLPFPDETFDTVTFIANLNHVPHSIRHQELKEAYRVLKDGGNIVVTMGNPIAEILVHWLVASYDRILGTAVDVDNERGMSDEESYYLTPGAVFSYLSRAAFVNLRRKRFWTQWGLNSLFEGWKS
ncbi:MAG: hypothetical protein Kow0040_25960 [Thermogutta sp.]